MSESHAVIPGDLLRYWFRFLTIWSIVAGFSNDLVFTSICLFALAASVFFSFERPLSQFVRYALWALGNAALVIGLTFLANLFTK